MIYFFLSLFSSYVLAFSSQAPDPNAQILSTSISGSTTPTPGGSSQAPDPNKRITWLRIILLMVIYIAFLATNPWNIWSIVLGVALLHQLSIFEPFDQKIDPLSDFIGKWFHMQVSPMFHFILRRRRFLYNMVIIIGFLLILAHLVVPPIWDQETESLCLNTDSKISCSNGIGVQTFLTTGQEPLTVGLLTYQQQGPFELGAKFNQPEAQVEQKIFTEDRTACTASQQHITLAVATMLSKTVEDISLSSQVGLEDLHGAALAQQMYNHPRQRIHDSSPYKLCLVIANLGALSTPPDALRQVLKQLVLYSKYDSTFRGVVGFPLSQLTQDSLTILDSWSQFNFPIVSPSVTSDDLANRHNFYSISASNATQSNEMLRFITQVFQTQAQASPVQMAILSDDTDAYSRSLARDMQSSIAQSPSPSNIVSQIYHYQIDNGASLQKPVTDALGTQHASLLYFAGYSYDLQALQMQIQAVQSQQHSHSSVVVLGGDGLYNTAAQQTRSPSSPVFATLYASPLSPTSSYVHAYTSAFGPVDTQGDLSLLPPHAILSFDAISAFTYTLDDLMSHQSDTTQADVNKALGNVSFQGLSGTITLQGSSPTEASMPSGRPVHILCSDNQQLLHVAADIVPGVKLQIRLSNAATCS